MEQKNKTDQFFREKLDQLEFHPSEQAWGKVQGAIGKKGGNIWPVYLKVAAGFALVLAMGILFYSTENQKTFAYQEVISPQPLEVTSIDTESLKGIEKRELSVVVENIPSSNHEIESEPDKEITTSERTPLDLTIIDDIRIADADILIKKRELQEAVKSKGVKITYYTASTNEQTEAAAEVVEEDSVKTNLIDKMRFFARNVSPVELITDLRTAKEELIENGLRKN